MHMTHHTASNTGLAAQSPPLLEITSGSTMADASPSQTSVASARELHVPSGVQNCFWLHWTVEHIAGPRVVILFSIWTLAAFSFCITEAILPWRGLAKAGPGFGLLGMFGGAWAGLFGLWWNYGHIGSLGQAGPEGLSQPKQHLVNAVVVCSWLLGVAYPLVVFCDQDLLIYANTKIFKWVHPIGVGISAPIATTCFLCFTMNAVAHHFEILAVVEDLRNGTLTVLEDPEPLVERIYVLKRKVRRSAARWQLLVDPALALASIAFVVSSIHLYSLDEEGEDFAARTIAALTSGCCAIIVPAILFVLTVVNDGNDRLVHFIDEEAKLFGGLERRNAIVQFLMYRGAIRWRVLGLTINRRFVFKAIFTMFGSWTLTFLKGLI
jgi:hypothetical protein